MNYWSAAKPQNRGRKQRLGGTGRRPLELHGPSLASVGVRLPPAVGFVRVRPLRSRQPNHRLLLRFHLRRRTPRRALAEPEARHGGLLEAALCFGPGHPALWGS